MKSLSKDKRLKAITCLKDYPYAYCCRFCRIIYGSNYSGEDGICPKHQLNRKDRK